MRFDSDTGGPGSGAIWLASYPRSGNTWARLALRSLLQGGAEVELSALRTFGRSVARRELVDRELEIDSGLLTKRETQELRPDVHAALFGRARAPILASAYDAWICAPSGRPVHAREITHAAIYLVRDPRDVAVSWARLHGWAYDRAIAQLADETASLGDVGANGGLYLCQPMRSWSAHVASWLDRSGLDPLLVRYEDMVADPHGAFARMASRIGWECSADAVEGAVAATRFERLADKEARHGFFDKVRCGARFYRSGKPGGWREELTREQAARIERDHGAVMARFGYL